MKDLSPSAWMVAGVLLLAPMSARATMLVKPMALDQITRQAVRIVHGTVTDIRLGRDQSGLPATWMQLAVAQTLKGPAAARVTIKQYGVSAPLADGTIARVAGLPHYKVGQEVVLFLHGDSNYGFTSPVGLGQGVYRVSRAATGPLVRSDAAAGDLRDLHDFLAEVTQNAAAQ